MWLHGPARRRTGVPAAANAATVRKLLLRYPSAQPATIMVGTVMLAYEGRSEPCRQYAPSSVSVNHRNSHGSVLSMRRNHSSRHPSPNTPGTGGSAFIATMYVG